MNNYIKEIVEICKLPFSEIKDDYKILQVGSKLIYVCNFKRIIDYSDSRIVLKIKNNTLEIVGSGLKIKQIEKSEIIISGFIVSCGLGVVGDKK